MRMHDKRTGWIAGKFVIGLPHKTKVPALVEVVDQTDALLTRVQASVGKAAQASKNYPIQPKQKPDKEI
jgi:hypothetical protein